MATPLPLSKPPRRPLKRVRLYRDDIERVIGAIVGAGFRPRIYDGRFEYASIEDAQTTAGDSPSLLLIDGLDGELPLVKIVLSRSECEATYGSASKATAQANAAAKAVAENVSSLLAGRQSMFAAVSPIAPAMVGVILLGIMMDLSKVSMDPRLSRAVIGLGTVAAFGGLALSTYLALYPRIVLNYQHKAGFLRRNLDTLLVGLIMAVLGVAFGALIK